MLHPLKATGLILLLAGATPAFADEAEDTEATTEAAADADTEAEAEDSVEAEDAEEEGEKFPISGSASLTHSFAHSEFVEDTDGIDSAGQFLSLGINLGYSVTDSISTSASISVTKVVDTGFLSGSSGSGLVNYETVLSDLNLGARWGFYTVPVADIRLAATAGLRLPTSKTSITRELIIAPRVGLSASRKIGPVNVSLSGGYNHNVWQNSTQRFEPRFVELIQVSGPDTGIALTLSGWNVGASVSYAILEGLSASVSYSLSNRISAVYGKDDEYTAEQDFIQTGVQTGTGAHGASFNLSYSLPFDTGTSISLGMSSSGSLYSRDGQRITNPFFDTETQQGIGTGYSISLSQAL